MFTKKQLKTRKNIFSRSQKRFNKGKPKFEDWYLCHFCGTPYYESSPFVDDDELDNYITIRNNKKGSWYYLHVSCHEQMLKIILGE